MGNLTDHDPCKKLEGVLCNECQSEGHFSAAVSAIHMYVPGLPKPVVLLPDGDYYFCLGCNIVWRLLTTLQQDHSKTKDREHWTRAVIVFCDGNGVDIQAIGHAPPIKLALMN